MNCCLVLLLLGIFVAVGDGAFPPGSCDGYTNISQAWRHALSSPPYFLENPFDDSFMVSNWWRFVGFGGDTVINICKTLSTGDLYSIGVEKTQIPMIQLSTATRVLAYSFRSSCPLFSSFSVDVVLCPGGFYVYKPLSHPASSSYTTWHSACKPNSCGPHAECFGFAGAGLCSCLTGFTMETQDRPPDDVLCTDIDECKDETLCTNGNCTNYEGGYNCSCLTGYKLLHPTDPPSATNQCTEINECVEDVTICGSNGGCSNTDGSYFCTCFSGYRLDRALMGVSDPCIEINECVEDVTICGSNGGCSNTDGSYFCTCFSGYRLDRALMGVSDPCIEINECVEDVTICGSNGGCSNTDGSYFCTCFSGYRLDRALMGVSDPCIEINECVEDVTICGSNGGCSNTDGSYFCTCFSGYRLDRALMGVSDPCIEINECVEDVTICGSNGGCSNTNGSYFCTCFSGYRLDRALMGVSDPCIEINECVEDVTICGSNGGCSNTDGSYFCTCFSGYRLDRALMGVSDPCIDIDECNEMAEICGPKSFCVNKPATYVCACSDRFFSSTGIIWTVDTVCDSIPDILNSLTNSQEKTKEKAFFAKMDRQLRETKGDSLHEAILTNSFSASMEVAGVGPFVNPPKVSSAGDGATGTIILDLSERLIEGFLHNNQKQSTIQIQTSTLDLDVVMFSPKEEPPKNFSHTVSGITMDINIEDLANNNNGFAAVAFMKVNGLDSLLSHQYFETENVTKFATDIFSVFLPMMNNTNLTDPVKFTIQHEKMPLDNGQRTCTYWATKEIIWEDGKNDEGIKASGFWSEEGCWVSDAGDNYTVCSCSHLSTFALIMQIGEPPPQSDFLDWLNRICVIIGLFFFTLAILTFLLCSWNPKINNTARLHLCLNLGLSHLLLLFNENFYADKLACKAIAGILHFLIVSSFVWMLLEAVQLYMLVCRLNKVQVIERDGLPKLALYFIGYGVPLVIVGVSAIIYNHGYGATDAKVCWLSTTRGFNWALTGPVITILALNLMLFCATLWSLRTILANMRKGASESKDSKLVLFKIVAQFVILGCTWILGLYQTNLFFQIMFTVLNSQQGTFLYVVHCLLNKEIREECLKCLSCSHNRNKDNTEEVWTTEEKDSTK